jgi:tRNA threonylcarbamoyladenosine biosynthesis protein TsaB
VLDARRGEVYGGVYDDTLQLVQKEVVSKLPVWLASLPQGDLEFVTHGFNIDGIPGPVVEAPRALAGSIGRIAFNRLERGEMADPAEIDANYVRRSDAELLWKDAWSAPHR